MTAAQKLMQEPLQALPARLRQCLVGMQFEFYSAPFVGRLYGIMFRRGLIDDVPQELNGKQIKVQYTSVMAMTQRQSGDVKYPARPITALAPMTAFDPQVTDIVDTRHRLPELLWA